MKTQRRTERNLKKEPEEEQATVQPELPDPLKNSFICFVGTMSMLKHKNLSV